MMPRRYPTLTTTRRPRGCWMIKCQRCTGSCFAALQRSESPLYGGNTESGCRSALSRLVDGSEPVLHLLNR